MNIQIIMHEAFEGPGAIESWIELNKHKATYTKLYQGDQLPSNCDNFDFLIVMGGPQSPSTTVEECAYFDSAAEQTLINNTVESNKAVLGICLGSQLLSNAMGGTTIASPNKEIGLYEVSLNEEGQKDPLLADFTSTFLCGHWHGDMPGLTDEAVILASSQGCPRQIVRFAPKAYAFQCHFEFTPSAIEDMITNCREELKRDKKLPFVQSPKKLRANDYSQSNNLLFGFLDKLVAL